MNPWNVCPRFRKVEFIQYIMLLLLLLRFSLPCVRLTDISITLEMIEALEERNPDLFDANLTMS